MAFFTRPLTLYEEKTIRQMLEQYGSDSPIGKRLEIVWLSHQRVKSGEISRQLGIMQETVRRWIKRFNREGLSCFRDSLEEQAVEVSDPKITDLKAEVSSPKILFAHPLSPADLALLKNLMATYRERELTLKRFQAILLSSQLLPVPKVSAEVGLSRAAVRFWIKQFNKSGFENLETALDRNWLARQLNPAPISATNTQQ